MNGDKTRATFAKLYGEQEQTIEYQTLRYKKLLRAYKAHFPQDEGELQLFSTPGRTEVGGNHTDHNARSCSGCSSAFRYHCSGNRCGG
ncbi:MAG: galactokinase family protein [Caldicoprobacterales bacterium]